MINEYFKKFNRGGGIDFMDGRDKADTGVLTAADEVYHIDNHAYLSNDEGEYAVFTVAEFPSLFFFGNQIITETLKQIDSDGMAASLPEVGVTFLTRVSKKNREYVTIDFVVE